MTKKELFAALARFEADPDRIITIRLLCELAGIHVDTYYSSVQRREYEITPLTQIRLEKALKAIERGEIKVMRKNRTKSIAWRRRPQPEFKRGMALSMKDGKIGLKIGLQNANCYTAPTFREEIDGHS